MPSKVLKELAVAVSSYEDRNTGQTKSRYENIGVLMQSENERGERNTFIMLKRTFNPAGVPFKPGSDKILISLFDPRDNSQGGDGNQSQQSDSRERGSQSGAAAGGHGRTEYDDEIPFAPEWRA